MSVALVERAELGGICLNWGCIPTKALLHSATVLRACREAAHYGVTGAGDARPDLAAMVARSRKVAGRLGQGVAHLMKKNGVTVFAANAKLAGSGKLALDTGATLSAKHIILATGARARELPALPVGERIWAYRQALAPAEIPKSLLVVCAGAIGADKRNPDAPRRDADRDPPPELPKRPAWQSYLDRCGEALRMALLSMNAHRLRTSLTMLGIIIGIAAVVSVVALGEGSRRKILEDISAIGTNTV
ncbi:hypothetical protein G6F57_018233 [Rhizopus arrhizus]|nr:hypothetical protein G6F57_018233 [Rhizopus arrhizus]